MDCEPLDQSIVERVGCDSHVETSKAVTLKWCLFNHLKAKIDECHDTTECMKAKKRYISKIRVTGRQEG